MEPSERVEPFITLLQLRLTVESGKLPDGRPIKYNLQRSLFVEIDAVESFLRRQKDDFKRLQAMTRLFVILGQAGFLGPETSH